MHEPLRLRPLWLATGWLLIATVVYLSLTPVAPHPFNLWDKAQHFLAYAVLSGWFLQIHWSAAGRRWVVVGLILLGVGLEVLQGLGGVRDFDPHDMLANALGVGFAALVVRKRVARVLLALERRLLRL